MYASFIQYILLMHFHRVVNGPTSTDPNPKSHLNPKSGRKSPKVKYCLRNVHGYCSNAVKIKLLTTDQLGSNVIGSDNHVVLKLSRHSQVQVILITFLQLLNGKN